MPSGILPSPLPTGLLTPGLWAVQDGFVNIFLVETQSGFLSVDAGWRVSRLVTAMQQLGLDQESVAGVLLTHHHWDHVRGLAAFPRAKLLNDTRDQQPSRLKFGGMAVEIIPCPGHTEDSVALRLDDRWLFTGDSLRLHMGRAWPNYSFFNRDTQTLRHSLQALSGLQPLEGLFTSHWGLSWNPAEALKPLRDKL